MFKPLIDSFNYFKCNQNYKKKLEELGLSLKQSDE